MTPSRTTSELKKNSKNPKEAAKTQKVIGYVVKRSFQVKVREVKIFPKLVDDLIATVNAEFSNYESIKEGYSKEKEVDKQLWEDAVANSRAEAERTLKNTGMKVDSITRFRPCRSRRSHRECSQRASQERSMWW